MKTQIQKEDADIARRINKKWRQRWELGFKILRNA